MSRPVAFLATLALFAAALLGASNSASHRTAAFGPVNTAQHPPAQSTSVQPMSASDAVQPIDSPIYSDDPADPWNRIFHALFTRTFESRVSDEFPDPAAGPFLPIGQTSPIRVSARTFERTEIGDGPIDPLYCPPATSVEGSRQLLVEPQYSELTAALQEAINETRPRSPLARALMQSDLWSAYDLIHWDLFPQDRGTILDAHKKTISDLMAQFIKKLALSPQEIGSLPDNYAVARPHDSLPDLFSANSDWIELQYFPDRLHDSQAEFRRVSRVFIKPSHPPANKQEFLNSLRNENAEASPELAGAVILIQPLLIDSQGRLTPSHLTTDVEVRLFQWSNNGAFQKTDVHTYELSRRLLLDQPATGGFEVQDENSPAYLSNGGSYGFAEEIALSANGGDEPHLPVVVKLRARCAHCHAENLTLLMTFAFIQPPHTSPPPVKQLDRSAHQAAEYDIDQKSKRAEWRALHAYFAGDAK